LSKYLEIKNWDKYQAFLRKGKPAGWIKDYSDKEADHGYSMLSITQRYVLDGCCRLRARLGKNLPNDPVYISRALSVAPEERHCIPRTVAVLIERGFLLLTNQQDDSLEKRREEKRESKEEVEKAVSELNSLTVRIPIKLPEPKPPVELGPDDLTFVVLREIGIPARNPELTTLVASAVAAKARSPDWTAEKAALHFIERGTAYKNSWVWNTKFKKSWIKWFQDECYDQDPQAWTQNGVDRNGNGKQTALDRNREALRKATEETSE